MTKLIKNCSEYAQAIHTDSVAALLKIAETTLVDTNYKPEISSPPVLNSEEQKDAGEDEEKNKGAVLMLLLRTFLSMS